MDDPSIAKDPVGLQSIWDKSKTLLRKLYPTVNLPETKPSSLPDPLDESAFDYHYPRYNNGRHRSIGNEANDDYNLRAGAQKAKSRAVLRNVEAHLKAGDDDQIALALRDTLDHPEMRPHTRRVMASDNSELNRVGRLMVKGTREIANKIATTKKRGMLSRTSRSTLSTLIMTVAAGGGDEKVSKREISRQLLPSFSRGAQHRILKKAAIKRQRFNEEDLKQFSLVDAEQKRWKFDDDEMESLQGYMAENDFTRMSPMKNDGVRKRDLNGNKIVDSDGNYVSIQRVLISKCPRGLHAHMVKEKKDGGYDRSRDPQTKEVRYSLSTIVAYWPNWLTIMNDGHMRICGCQTCVETDDVQLAYNSKRRKIVRETEAEILDMAEGPH